MKFTNATLILLALIHFNTFRPDAKYIYFPFKNIGYQEDQKEKAFEILRIKCNTCHAIKRKPQLFTKLNMDMMAAEIYEQVFYKKENAERKKR